MALKPEMLPIFQVKLERILSCTMCNKFFINKNKLNKHLNIHNACLKVVSNSMYEHMVSATVNINALRRCKSCNLVFKNKQEAVVHSVSHIEYRDLHEDSNGGYVKKYKCEECDAKFVAESTLEAHAKVHEPYPHNCSFCGIGFYQQNDLKSHIDLVHEKAKLELEQRLKQEAREEKENLRNLKYAESEHKPKKLIGPKLSAALDIPKSQKPKSKKYKKGKSRFGNSFKLKIKAEGKTKVNNDFKLVHNNGIYECPICNEPSYSKKNILEHILELHQDSELSPCTDCRKIFKSKDDYESHYDDCHKTRFTCEHCNKSFKYKFRLASHVMQVHLGVKIRCQICNKGYTQSPNLKRHMKSVHKIGDLTKFKCNMCNKEFESKAFLVRHQIIHTGVKPYKCNFCDQAFSDPSARGRHVRLHTNDFKYSCEYCEKKFTDNSQYLVHKLRHEDNKRHLCEICKRSFYTLSCLKRHIITHTDIMPYRCDYCEKLFQCKYYLSRHIKVTHLKWPECKKCHTVLQNEAELKRHQRKPCRKLQRVSKVHVLPVEE